MTCLTCNHVIMTSHEREISWCESPVLEINESKLNAVLERLNEMKPDWVFRGDSTLDSIEDDLVVSTTTSSTSNHATNGRSNCRSSSIRPPRQSKILFRYRRSK